MSEQQQKEAVEVFNKIFANSGTKVTASEVMQGLTRVYQLEMISSIPRPEIIVKAKCAKFTLEALGYEKEASLVDGLIQDYLMTYTSHKGKNNRANKIIEAFASLFRAELEIEKSKKGMFTK